MANWTMEGTPEKSTAKEKSIDLVITPRWQRVAYVRHQLWTARTCGDPSQEEGPRRVEGQVIHYKKGRTRFGRYHLHVLIRPCAGRNDVPLPEPRASGRFSREATS